MGNHRSLVEPVYKSKKYGYEHLTINAAAVTQIITLTEQEARYRLTPARAPATAATVADTKSNSEALQMLMNSSSRAWEAVARPCLRWSTLRSQRLLSKHCQLINWPSNNCVSKQARN